MRKTELFDHCDICVEEGEDGWANLLANEAGRRATQALFPETQIKWTAKPVMPPDGKGGSINIPNLMLTSPGHKLVKIENDVRDVPDEIMRLADSLDRQGARVIVRNQQGRFRPFERATH